jgi:transposase
MCRHAPLVECPAEDRRELERLSRSRREEARRVERSQIILHALAGKPNQEIAALMGLTPSRVGLWRGRFAREGLRGLQDRPRSGKPATYDAGLKDRVLKKLEETPPPERGCWDGALVAQALGVSRHKVWRILRAQGIGLARQRSWCVSTDPQFAPKAADIIGLYLNAPLHALVLSVDEKPSIQALPRPCGYVKSSDGKVVRGLKSTYKRNGTLNLFAALEVASGYVHAKTTETKKREDFRQFLDEVLAEVPADKEIHVILDNYSTHKKNDDWLARYQGRVSFHFTSTSASWLNLVEVFFGLLTRQALRGASFLTKESLRDKILADVAKHNRQPKPFRWRKREVKGSQLRATIINLCN